MIKPKTNKIKIIRKTRLKKEKDIDITYEINFIIDFADEFIYINKNIK